MEARSQKGFSKELIHLGMAHLFGYGNEDVGCSLVSETLDTEAEHRPPRISLGAFSCNTGPRKSNLDLQPYTRPDGLSIPFATPLLLLRMPSVVRETPALLSTSTGYRYSSPRTSLL